MRMDRHTQTVAVITGVVTGSLIEYDQFVSGAYLE
jgi:hypothetical protein